MFKTRLDTFGNDFGHFCNFEKFLIFLKISEDSTLHGKLSKKNFSKKINPKHVQTTFGHFWERFWALLQFGKVFDFFLKISEESTLHGILSKKNFRKN